ncbi:MAG: hypothetical protein M0P13_06505, partial [Fibrobacteraceae bacterium]|nr:hypothetical protein [Fibrobacteraceae bacterium]
ASLSATLNLGDFDASRHHCGSVIQPSELGCATLTLHGIDASRHRPLLHLGNKDKQACLCCARFVCYSLHQSNF